MAKVSDEARKKYFERIGAFKKSAAEILEKEERIENIIAGGDPGAEYKRIVLAQDNLILASQYLIINNLSVALLGVKNETSLNDARRACYKILINLEKVFTNFVDVPFSEYENALANIESFPELERYEMIRKVGFSIDRVIVGFGENTKWKWSFIDLHARLATIAKNCINLKSFVAGMDPRMDGFQERIEHFNLTRRLLQSAADSYRKKYELSTHRMDDFRQAISYLGALKRLSLLLGRQQESVALKKKMEIWKSKMDTDQKNSELAKRHRPPADTE